MYTRPYLPPEPRHTRLQLALRAALVAALYLAASIIDGNAEPIDEQQEPPAICGTDTECAEHCPPPADDPDCDGGPEWLPLPTVYQARWSDEGAQS